MSRYLLDTGIVIRHLRGRKNVVQMLRGLGQHGRLCVSAITRLEIHARMHPDEQFVTQKLLSRFLTFDLDKKVADRAGDYVYQTRKQGIVLSVPDAIIAATAVQHNLSLVTLNRADFAPIPGLSLQPIDLI
jgi:predicted nucleic acid-binding protein